MMSFSYTRTKVPVYCTTLSWWIGFTESGTSLHWIHQNQLLTFVCCIRLSTVVFNPILLSPIVVEIPSKWISSNSTPRWSANNLVMRIVINTTIRISQLQNTTYSVVWLMCVYIHIICQQDRIGNGPLFVRTQGWCNTVIYTGWQQ